MGTDIDKDQFCKEWKKNGGIQRLCRQRVRRIEELEAEVAAKDRQYEEADARHMEIVDALTRNWKKKVAELEDEISRYSELIANKENEMAKVSRERAELGAKLNTVREAFSILGFTKEVV